MAKIMRKMLALVLVMAICCSFALPAFASEPAEASIGPNSINKVAGKLENDMVDVTLSVPGEEVDLSSDIVFIIGHGPASNYDYIVDMIHKMLVAVDGTPTKIKIGMVGFADTTEEETVLELTEMVDTVPGNTVADYRFASRYYDSANKVYTESVEDYAIRKAAYEALVAECDADPAMSQDMEYIIARALERAEAVYNGINMESSLITARDMLAADEDVPADRKHMIVISTGLTYWFDDESGDPSTIAGTHNEKGNYMTGNKYWLYARNAHTNTNPGYVIPSAFYIMNEAGKVDYVASWKNYWSYIERWVAADQNNYVFTPVEKNYGDFWAGNQKEIKSWGYAIQTPENIEIAKTVAVPKFKGGANPITTVNAAHALNYERAQYDALMVYRQMETPIGESVTTLLKDVNGENITLPGLGFNCYAIAIGKTPEPGNESTWLESNQIGYNFMCMMGGDNTVNYNDGDLSFFDAIENKILYTCAAGSYVEDYIGYNRPDKGNFEFVQDPTTITMVRGGVTYTTIQIDTKEGATASYKFSADGEQDFFLDYYYGNGKDTEKFIWTFGDYVSIEKRTSLTYKLELTEKAEEAGTYTVDTNLSATLYPIDSDGKEGKPVDFPVPSVTYEVVPYDVDIVIALGAGIAKYDGVHSSYSHTLDSIVGLVEPLVTKGVKVKLGLVAVEHYDDVAMELTLLDKNTFKGVIAEGLNTIINMPAGPTNLHGNIEAAKAMLEADTAVPAKNKFFYVIATGRTYNYDNEQGVPTTIVNKIALKGNTYYYWGHYLWQSQRGGHTSLYMIPDRYNNDFEAYWADVCKWVEADGDKYAYSFTDAYNVNDPQWFNTFYAANNKDAKALGLASSRFGWIMNPLTNSGHAGIGSGSNPQNALGYERAQYEAYQAYQEMVKAGYTCEAISSESANYRNGSEYITLGAGYKGTSTIQLGDSFMDFLNGGEAKNLFDYERNADGSLKSTTVVFETTDYFTKIDTSKLVKTETKKIPMYSTGPKLPAFTLNNEIEGVIANIGEKFAITVDATGEGLTYQWYYMNKGDKDWSISSFTGKSYAMTMASYCHERQVYCVITDAYGRTIETNAVTILRPAMNATIIGQPQDVEAAIGEKFSITVNATGDGLTYQWFYKNKGAKEFTASSFTGKSYAMTMAEYCHERQVYCVITDAYGNSVTTETVTITRPAIALEIVKQPQSVEVAIGEKVTISVEAKGDGLTYQWYYKNASGKAFALSSFNGKTYSMTMAEYCNGRQVYCVITDAYGNSVTTEIATMTRPAYELQIVGQLEDVTVASGARAAVTVEAQGDGLTYQWYYKNANGKSFALSSITGKTYAVSMGSYCDGRQVYCVITDAEGNTVTTDVVTLYMAD